MISQFISYWNYGTTYASIELTSIEAKPRLYGLIAKKNKGEFSGFQYFESAKFSELAKKFPKKQHAFLTINNDQVLVNEISKTEDSRQAVSKAFPGTSSSDFYFEVLQTPFKTFVAICRKEVVNKIIESANKEGIETIGFCLGFFRLKRIIPLLEKNSVHTSRHLIEINESNISTFIVSQTPSSLYKVENITVESNYLLSLAGLTNYQSAQIEEEYSNFSEINNELRTNQSQLNFFRKTAITFIGLLLLILGINFFVFNKYFDRHSQLKSEVQISKNNVENYNQKSKEIEKKERSVRYLLNNESSRASYYINRIVARRPPSILFNTIEYQPLRKPIRTEKKITLSQNKIIITGESSDSSIFSNWIQQLENRKWTDSLTVVSYNNTKKTSSFELFLNIKSDSEE